MDPRRPHSSMDRVQASEAWDPSSILGGGIGKSVRATGHGRMLPSEACDAGSIPAGRTR